MNATTQVTPVSPNYDNLVDKRSFKFNFRTAVDEFGNKTKRPSVELDFPVPSVEGLAAIINNGGKGLELLMEVVANFVVQNVKVQVDENENITQETLDFSKLSWEAIANMPKAERTGGGIPKETWEAFAADYLEVMPALTGKKPENVANACKAFLNKFAAIKTNKAALEVLKGQLGIYMSGSPNAESFTDVIAALLDKADKFLNMSDEDFTASL